jgi:hypothetical protein
LDRRSSRAAIAGQVHHQNTTAPSFATVFANADTAAINPDFVPA